MSESTDPPASWPRVITSETVPDGWTPPADACYRDVDGDLWIADDRGRLHLVLQSTGEASARGQLPVAVVVEYGPLTAVVSDGE